MSGLILHLSISQSHVFLLNSRLGLFTAAPHSCGAPLLPKLQGNFAEFLSHDSLEHLRILSSTTCVGLRYGWTYAYRQKFFLEALRDTIRSPEGSRYCQVRLRPRISLRPKYLHPSTRYSVTARSFHHSVTPSPVCPVWEYSPICHRNPLRVILRSRLTLIRLALIRKPWSIGVGVSRPHYRYLCLHLLFQNLQHTSPCAFTDVGMLPYQTDLRLNPTLRYYT